MAQFDLLGVLQHGPLGDSSRRKRADGRMIGVQRKADLLEVVRAVHSASRLAGGLDRGQQQRDENADDGNHHQKLDQRKAGRDRQAT